MCLYTPICSLYTILIQHLGYDDGQFQKRTSFITLVTGYMDLPSATQLSVYVPAEVAVETTLKYLNMFSLLGSYDAL